MDLVLRKLSVGIALIGHSKAGRSTIKGWSGFACGSIWFNTAIICETSFCCFTMSSLLIVRVGAWCQMLFLDEPSAAVDAGAKRHLWKVIKSRGPDQTLGFLNIQTLPYFSKPKGKV